MQNENDEDKDLLSQLSELTEPKEPSEKQPKSFVWQDDDLDGENEPQNQTETQANTTSKPIEGANKNLSPEEIKLSAQSSAAGVELITSLLSEAIINLRYYNKFTDDERTRLDEEILDKNPTQLNEEELRLSNKWHRLMARKKEKEDKISISDKARKNLEDSFAAYTELTGKTFLTPKSRLWVFIAEHTIKSVIAAATD
jgi:hypothetical protein